MIRDAFRVVGVLNLLLISQIETWNCASLDSDRIIDKRVPCRPHPTVVDLSRMIDKPDEPELGRELSVRTFPSHIIVNRCLGDCAGLQSLHCDAVKVDVIKTTLSVTICDDERCDEKCVDIDVENHTSCNCQCKLDQKLCKPFHVFSKNDCSCKCPDATKRSECLADELSGLRIWDESSCRCFCSRESFRVCDDGKIFDFQSTCRCVTRDQLWKPEDVGRLEITWELTLIMILSCATLFLATVTVLMAKRISIMTNGTSHRPLSEQVSPATSLMQ